MQRLGDGLWIARKDFEVPAFGNIGGCATILEYEPGQLMIVSPVKFTDGELKEIEALGRVRWLVSPNPIHHLYLPRAHRAFPEARLAGPGRTALKQSDLKFDVILTAEGAKPWSAGVDTLRVQARSPVDEEYLFFHRASRTLVVTDFLFNLPQSQRPWNKIWRKINRVDQGLAISRMSQLFFNKASAGEALGRIQELAPENLVMAHGVPIAGGAAEMIAQARGLPAISARAGLEPILTTKSSGRPDGRSEKSPS